MDDSGMLRSALAELADLSLTTLGLDAALIRIAELAVTAIPGAEHAGLTLVAGAGLGSAAATATFVSNIDALQYALGEGPAMSAEAQGETVRSGSLRDDQRWPTFGPQAAHIGVHSALALALPISNEAVRATGSMTVYSPLEASFDEESRRIAEIFAVPAAMALRDALVVVHNLRAIEQLKTSIASRAVIDQAIGILMSRTGGNSNAAFTRLRALSQQGNRKLAEVAHDMVEEAARRARSRATPPHRYSEAVQR